MKVCIPTGENKVAQHFGKAKGFALVSIEDGKISSVEVVPNPGRETVKVPVFVAAFGVTHVIAAGIGNPAIAILAKDGIEVYSGAAGSLESALGSFVRGELKNKKMSCAGENKCGAQCPKD